MFFFAKPLRFWRQQIATKIFLMRQNLRLFPLSLKCSTYNILKTIPTTDKTIPILSTPQKDHETQM